MNRGLQHGSTLSPFLINLLTNWWNGQVKNTFWRLRHGSYFGRRNSVRQNRSGAAGRFNVSVKWAEQRGLHCTHIKCIALLAPDEEAILHLVTNSIVTKKEGRLHWNLVGVWWDDREKCIEKNEGSAKMSEPDN